MESPTMSLLTSRIKEFRAMPSNDLTLNDLVSYLNAFKLSNYDNRLPKIENGFNLSLSSNKEKTNNDENNSNLEEQLDEIEAKIARRLLRGKRKFKCQLPLICFKSNEVGHFSARCPKNNRNDKNDKKEHK